MNWEIMYSRYAIVWTEALLHFVWQGAVLGLAAWAALRSAAQPRTRYAIACLALVLMALAPLLTVGLTLRDVPRGVALQSGVADAVPGGAIDSAIPSAPFDWSRFVLPVWLAGVLILAIRAAGGWSLAFWRVTHGRVPAARDVEDAVRALARHLGVRRAIGVFASANTEAPTVFGWIRPVLLVPVSAITGLGPDQLRAVLAHEVAHVARHDFAVNCVQSAVEVLLFYHPAVWWMSRRIREEREMCCDEAAVGICGDAQQYSRALLALEENRHRFVLAATGGSLKSRIERLLLRDEPVSSLGLAAAGVLAAVGSGVAMSTVPVVAMPPVPPIRTVAVAATAPPPAALAPVPAGPAAGRPQNVSARRPEVQYAYAQPQAQAQAQEAPRQQPEMQQYSTVKKGSRPGIPAGARRPVVFIMTREQQDQYVLLQDDAARDRFVEQFWAGHTAEERAEHERRVRYADQRFGWDTTRGRTYIKEGPPDAIETRPGELWEIWTYNASGQKYTFAGEGYGMVAIDYGSGRMGGMITSSARAGTPDDEGEVTIVSVRDNQGREIAGVTPGSTPYYPLLARRARIQGEVVVRGSAGADGKVQTVSVVSGHPLLVQSAQDAVRRWTFGTGAQFEVTIRFALKASR